ncbi:MAG TPA: ABC transporter ATP-binding protein/permease, partial [Candidatus Paenibacillus intestinavium]|nr:ABC transporter ATP-binding protein/permease [Candidatus Paenibacillus intestinavium]
MSMMIVMLPRAQVSAARINVVLDIEPTITDHNAQAVNTKQALGIVSFNNVSFTYPGAEKPAISNINFECRPGEVTAIIGGTGSGKSTIINLIERFFDCNEGSIDFSGVNVKNWSIEQLRGNMSLVPQKTTIFSGTIAENIRQGKQDATDEELREAATIAQAIGFIEKMEQGFDTVLAQGGTNISGGQKQRLSIARALVRRPSLYLFDDSFSALDYKTDSTLREALKDQVSDAAMIIVAQRISTVMTADQIIVLDEGELVGKGTHAELLESSDVYREIVQSQLTEEESA